MPEPVLLVDPPVVDVDDYVRRGGGAGLARARSLGPGGTIQEVLLSGLRGRGSSPSMTWSRPVSSPNR